MNTPDNPSHANNALKPKRKTTPGQLAALAMRKMPPFEPTDEHRALVTAMAGLKVTAEEIRQLIINPRTGEPIARDLLWKYFRAELEAGKAKLKSLIGSQYIKKLNAGEWPAIHFGLRNVMGYTEDAAGAVNVSATPEDGIQISFVLPSKRED